jgi:hypothetical protein
MSPVQRIGVYHHAYRARLVECLADDYPALQVLLGSAEFTNLCHAYVARFTPRAPSLNEYAQHMHAFCREQPLANAELLSDLARLEWASAVVVHQPQVAPLTASDIAAQQGAWEDARVRAVPALRLLTLQYPVLELYRSLRAGRSLPMPAAAAAHVLVHRPQWNITCTALSQPEGNLLARLLSGVPLGQALASDVEASEAEVSAWFQRWVGSGLFSALDVA